MTKKQARSGKTVIFGVIFLIAAGIWILTRFISSAAGGISGENDYERTAFIESFGWDAGNVPVDIEAIPIPVEFDEAYEEYNALQREQGFDLRKFRAHIAKKYTYELRNSDGSSLAVPLCANLIVIDGKIVGADISSRQAGGLVTVLAKK